MKSQIPQHRTTIDWMHINLDEKWKNFIAYVTMMRLLSHTLYYLENLWKIQSPKEAARNYEGKNLDNHEPISSAETVPFFFLSWFAISILTSKDTSRQENSRRCTCSHSWLQPKYHNPYLKSNRSYGNFQSQLYPLQCWAHQSINNQIVRCNNQSHLPLCRFNYMNQMMSFCFEQNKFFNNSTSFLIICLRINLSWPIFTSSC